MNLLNAAREIIESNYQRKQVFLVPQSNIGQESFDYPRIKMPDGAIYNWEITHNLYRDESESTVELILQFLLSKNSHKGMKEHRILGGCTAAVSYAALLGAWKKLTTQERHQ